MKKQPYPITQLTGGLDVSVDTAFLEDKASPETLEVMYDKGLLKKDMGKTSLGLPLLGVPLFYDVFYLTTGTTYITAFTTTSAYKLDETLLEWEDITQGVVLDTCESAWTASVKVTSTADTTLFKVGTKSAKHVIAADFTTGLASYYNHATSANLTTYTQIHMWVYSTIALAAGDYKFYIDDTDACASPLENIAFPALTAATWTRVSLTIATPAALATVHSWGLNVAVDKGANTFYMDDIRGVKEFTGDEDNIVFSTTLNDTYITVNGKDAIQKWTGSGTLADLAGSPPTCAKTICAFQNRLLLGGTTETGTDYPQRMRWSSAGTIETWSGGTSGYIDLTDTVDWVMHLKLLKGKCMCYKDYSIWEILYIGGTAIFKPELRVNGSGTMAPNTIVDRGETHVFYSDGNIIEFDGFHVITLADQIVPLLYETGSKVISLATVGRATSLILEEIQTYLLCFPEEEILFKYNFKTKSWMRYNSKPIYALGYYYSSATLPTWTTASGIWSTYRGSWAYRNLPANAPTTLMGWDTGQTYEDDRVTLSTSEMVWVTKDFYFTHSNRLTEVRVTFRYGGFTLYYSIDGGISYTSLSTFAYEADWTEGVKYLNITTQRIRFKISTSETRIEVRWIEPWYIPRVRSKTLTES